MLLLPTGQWLGRTWLRSPHLAQQDFFPPLQKVPLRPLPPPPGEPEPERSRVSIETSSSSIVVSDHSHVTTANEVRRYAVYQPLRRNVDSG